MLLSHFITTIGWYWQMLLPVGCCWLMLLAIVADVETTVFIICGDPQLVVVADVMATFWIGWCYCHSGGWNYHIVWAEVLPNVTVGTAIFVTAIWLIWLVADGIATLCDWQMLLPWWQMLCPLVGCVWQMLLPWWQML